MLLKSFVEFVLVENFNQTVPHLVGNIPHEIEESSAGKDAAQDLLRRDLVNTVFVDDLLNPKQLFRQVAGQQHLRDAAKNCAFDKIIDVDASRTEQVILGRLRPDR